MPPWKRHKFELVGAAEARAAPGTGTGKGGGGGGGGGGCCQACPPGSAAAAAALGSLAGACPSSGPREGALLRRVGRLFRSKRRKLRVSREAPTYSALYLGNAATLQAKGEGCTDAAVGRIWAKSEAGRRGTPMKLSVGPQGLRLAPAAAAAAAAAPPPPGHLYLLPRVTYCVADPRLPRLFAWVYRHEGKHKAVLLRCHAVLLSRAHKARALALLLGQTSAAALADFRRLKKRADARHRRLLPAAVPAAKPPVERSRGAPKLPAISEDWLGEELEERRGEAAAAGAGAPSLRRLVRDLGRLAIGDDPRRGRPPPSSA